VEFEPTVIDSNIVSLKVKPELYRPELKRGHHLGLPHPVVHCRRWRRTKCEGESLIISGLTSQERNDEQPYTGAGGVRLGNLFGQPVTVTGRSCW
jgi:Flp pilus assembly secretin CpaC